jgi:hypothetical protein
MAFLDISFPRGVAAAVSRGLVRKVDILTLVNGEERRNARWRNWLMGRLSSAMMLTPLSMAPREGPSTPSFAGGGGELRFR